MREKIIPKLAEICTKTEEKHEISKGGLYIVVRKRLRFLISMLLFALLFASCGGGGKPSNMSDDMYEAGLAALETANDYIDGTISADSALSRIKHAYDSASNILDRENDENGGAVAGTDVSADALVPHNILMLQTSISKNDWGSGSMSSVKSCRDTLAKQLGQ